MIKRLIDWLINGINWENIITKKRGNLREAVSALKEVGIEREYRRRFIEKYNTKSLFSEFLL